MAVAKELVERIMSLFEGHKNAHGSHGEPVRNGLKWEIKTTARTHRTPATLELWTQHVEGKRPLGIVPIDENSMCKWGSIDVDEYDIDLLKMVKDAEELPLVPCKSKSGGLHLFLFTTEPVPAREMQATLHSIAASLGRAGSEIFPKQTNVLTEKGDVGNWMVMPYFGGTYNGKLHNQHGLKKTGAEMTLSEFLTFASKKALTPAQFESFAKSTRSMKVTSIAGGKGKGKKGGTVGSGAFGDGPPCLQHMAIGGFPEGGRNNALFMLGLYLKKAAPSEWQRRLEEDNQKYMKPPLSADEVTQVRKQLERKDYEYTCAVEPMKSHCDKGICRTRKHGVGNTGNYPTITNIRKMNSEPAIWFVSFGDKTLDLSTVDLLNYSRFQLVCADNHSVVFSNMKQADWIGILQEATQGMEILDPPPDVSTQGRFLELMEDFLTNRAKGTRKEDILSGRPWLDESDGMHYFRLVDFQKFLAREGVKEFTRGQLTRRIEKMKGAHKFFNIKNKQGVNVWYIPDSEIQHTPSVEPKDIKGDDI